MSSRVNVHLIICKHHKVAQLSKHTYERYLDESELQRLSKIQTQSARFQYALTRSLLKLTLAEQLNCDPQTLQFTLSKLGKPELSSPQSSIQFNVSHTIGLSAIIWSSNVSLLGIDTECWTRRCDIERLSSRVLAAEELRFLESLQDGESRRRAFFRYWTLKEAYLKARGIGIGLPLREIAFELGPEAYEQFNQPVGYHFGPGVHDSALSWYIAACAIGKKHYLAFAADDKECSWQIQEVDEKFWLQSKTVAY